MIVECVGAASRHVRRQFERSDGTRKMGRGISPDHKWIKIWDSVMLVLLICVAFVMPYVVGVSVGWRSLESYTVKNISATVDLAFFVDTILYFFRAYRDFYGHEVFDLRRIRRR